MTVITDTKIINEFLFNNPDKNIRNNFARFSYYTTFNSIVEKEVRNGDYQIIFLEEDDFKSADSRDISNILGQKMTIKNLSRVIGAIKTISSFADINKIFIVRKDSENVTTKAALGVLYHNNTRLILDNFFFTDDQKTEQHLYHTGATVFYKGKKIRPQIDFFNNNISLSSLPPLKTLKESPEEIKQLFKLNKLVPVIDSTENNNLQFIYPSDSFLEEVI